MQANWGCVGFSTAVYASGGPGTPDGLAALVQKPSEANRDGWAMRDGVPGRGFRLLRQVGAAIQEGFGYCWRSRRATSLCTLLREIGSPP